MKKEESFLRLLIYYLLGLVPGFLIFSRSKGQALFYLAYCILASLVFGLVYYYKNGKSLGPMTNEAWQGYLLPAMLLFSYLFFLAVLLIFSLFLTGSILIH